MTLPYGHWLQGASLVPTGITFLPPFPALTQVRASSGRMDHGTLIFCLSEQDWAVEQNVLLMAPEGVDNMQEFNRICVSVCLENGPAVCAC